jgi:predicted O-methyltransferase YrrM
MADLLLHSLKEFDEVIFELIDRTGAASILEIGSESGGFSLDLLEHCERTGRKLTTVEPFPSPQIVEPARKSEVLDLIVGLSVDYLREGCPADFVLVDGDHNYWTVSEELRLIDRSWTDRNRRGLILIHDVEWPCARRDSYYDPSNLPAEGVHPHSFTRGVTLHNSGTIKGGFRSNGHYAIALHEGGERNGVLTAVEDFLRDRPEYGFRSIDAVFGLGAVFPRGGAIEDAVNQAFSRYDNDLIRRLERNRLDLYLRVLALQDQLDALRSRRPYEGLSGLSSAA